MKNPIILFRFYDNIKLQLVLASLAQEGIEAEVRDENTARTLSMFEAAAMGGAKILVDESDYARGSEILIQAGLIVPNDNPQDFLVLQWLDSFSQTLPILGKADKQIRVFFAAGILVIIPFLAVIAWMLSNAQ